MKTKINLKYIGPAIALLAILESCKAPMATAIEDHTKEEIPQNYQHQATDTPQQNSGLIPWKQFFTDPELSRLIDIALKNNQDLMITLQEIEMAKANVLYKNGLLKPTVTAGAGAGIEKVGRYTNPGAGDASTNIDGDRKVPDWLPDYRGGISAEWEVDLWHRLRTEKKSAVAHYLSTVEGKNFVLSQLISEVAGNYYDLLALDNQLDIIQKYTVLQQKALEVSKIQKQAMAATELAVKKFEAELAKSKASEFDLRQQITEKENLINSLLGRFPQPIERNKENFMKLLPQTVYTGVPNELLDNRPDIKAAELELQAAKLDVEAARKEFYPSLRIGAQLGLDAFNPAYLLKLPESLAANMVGDLAGPVINKTAIQANFKTADAKQIQALYEYDKTIVNAYLEVANLMSKIKNMDGYWQLKAEQSKALDDSNEIANLLFKNSRADYLEVLLNQRDALDAKIELVEAKKNQLSAVVEIYRSLGGGWK